MSRRYKELAKNTILITIGNFSSKILGLLLIPLYTSYLSTAEYGFYDLAYTTIQLLFPILTLGVTESIMYFLLRKKMGEKDVLSINVIFILIASTIFSLLLLLNHILKIFPEIDSYAPLVALFYLVFCLNNCLVQFAKGVDEVKHMTVAGVLGTAATLLANILALVVFNMGLRGYFIANIFGFLVPVLYLFIALKCWRYLRLKNRAENYKRIVLFALPLVVNTLSWWVNNAADRYIVAFFRGTDANGLLSVAYKIPSALAVVGGIFIQAWQISAIKEYSKNAREFYARLFFVFNGALVIISGFLIIFSEPMARVMFANDFYNAWQLVPFLLLSSLFNQNAGFLGAILTAGGRLFGISMSAVVGVIFNIVLNIIFTICFGPIGITVATMISSFIIYAMRKHYAKGDFLPEKYTRIVLSWILLIVMAVVVIALNNYYITVPIYLALVVIYKDIFSYILDFLKRKKMSIMKGKHE